MTDIAAVYAGHRFLDVLVHGWDLALASGQDHALDPLLLMPVAAARFPPG
jgi:hypothetical protein